MADYKSTITDDADRNNGIIDWEGAKKIDRESNRNTRWTKEVTWTIKTTPVINLYEEMTTQPRTERPA